MGIGEDSIVAVCLDRSPEYLVALIAILKAGGAFLPLDPRYPAARLRFMLEDSQTPLLIANSRFSERLGSQNSPATIFLDIEGDEGSSPETGRELGELRSVSTSQSLLYAIYTSGSTGKPKGVLCPQAGLLNRLRWMWGKYPFEPGEKCCQIVALSFVDSIYEIFAPLLQGVEIEIIPDEIRGSPRELWGAVERHGITRITLVPSVLSHFLDCAPGNRDAIPLKYCYVSGEVLLAPLVKRFQEALPDTILINFYGASELGNHATWFEVPRAWQGNAVPIGRPIPNSWAYVLDPGMRPVPDGMTGELYMGGGGLARGYLNRPELTAERFLKNPFDETGSSRLFKTGDLCRRLPDGGFKYLGRMDQQVKIRGNRVEPAEVEAALNEHPGVRECVVTARQSRHGEQQLLAWVISHQAGELSAGDLRAFLKQTLPDYLVPSHFVFVPLFPRLPNGKVNRRELADRPLGPEDRVPASSLPIGRTERRLQSMWQELLDCGPMGRDDDFFDLGGDSLIAARMAALMEERLHVGIPATALYEAPTIAQLARLVEGAGMAQYPPNIRPIQPFGSGARFFCFGAGADIRRLSRELGPEQPLFGINLESEDLAWLAPFCPMEEIARRLVASLQAFQPEGPYVLGGYSAQGLLALEAARQLREQGQKIAALLLLDTQVPLPVRRKFSPLLRAGAYTHAVWERVSEKDIRGILRHLRHLARLVWSFIRRGTGEPEVKPSDHETDPRNILQNLIAAAEAKYVPAVHRGSIVFFETEEQVPGGAAGSRFGWDHLCDGPLVVRTVPGDHHSMFLPAYSRELAGEVRVFLDQARDTARPSRSAAYGRVQSGAPSTVEGL